MAITAAELILYGAANTPDDDTSTVGGAISTVKRVLDSQFTSNAVAAVVSSAAGDTTQTATVEGRLADGSVDTEVLNLNGTTEAVGTKTWERILSVTLSATTTGTITFRQGAGGTTRHSFAPGETFAYILFRKAVSAGTAKDYYEKVFWKNTNTTTALTSATVALTAEPGTANIRIALEDAVNDTGTATNRITEPTGISAWQDGTTPISVPGGQLGDATTGTSDHIGVWFELVLGIDQAAEKTSLTTQVAGQTT